MAEWTKDPKETGAYWYKIPDRKADIVWFHNGTEFFLWGSSCYPSKQNFEDLGGMYYGPLDQPPPMPSELKPIKGPLMEVPEPEKQVNPTAHEAAVAWAQAQARQFTDTTGAGFGKAVAEVYKACLAEIEAKTEAPKVAPLSALERQRLKDVNDINAIADNIERMRQYRDHANRTGSDGGFQSAMVGKGL